MNVLLVGSGGREHALAWKLRQSSSLGELHAAPGNPGIARCGECHPVAPDDAEALLALAREIGAGLVVIGPEGPLVAGLADELRHAGVPVFGPGGEAARIEGLKAFAKDVMAAAGVPTAARLAVARPPCVIKADGLAAGKGVFVCRDEDELDAALQAVAAFGSAIVIEELLGGEEVSLFALTDGQNAVALPAARDYSPVDDDDRGPNTGGMGSFAPVPDLTPADVEELTDAIHRPVLAELAGRGAPFVGVLYAGVMLTDEGPRVLEFNCRFGDPETQALLPILDVDLLDLLALAATGDLGGIELASAERAAVTVVLAAPDYPARGDVGSPIDGVDAAERLGALVFHAGTALHDSRLVTNGGRILGVTGVGGALEEAREHAYQAVAHVSFAGMRFRRDIAAPAATRQRV